MTRRLSLTLLACVATAATSCALIGIESDEIDVADSDTAAEETGLSSDDGDGTDDGGEHGGTDGETSGSTMGTEEGDDANSDTGGESPCDELVEVVLEVGDNPLDIDGAGVLEGSCGAPGPEVVGEFQAPADGSFEFAVAEVEFDGVFYVSAGGCGEMDELDCATPETSIVVEDVAAGEVFYVVVDASAGPASATLVITVL